MTASAKQPWTTVYDMDYFSGSQMFLYVGDVWIDEVTSLQYTTYQQKTPVRGYASQLWDDCVPGPVQVQGEFTINFKEQGYLWAVLRRALGISASTAGVGISSKKDNALLRKQSKLEDGIKKGSKVPGAFGDKPLVGSNGTRISRATIERLTAGEATTGERYEFYNSMAGYASYGVDSPKDRVFEDIVEAFEDQVWSTKTNTDLNQQLRRTDDNKFDGFDIYVVFGNYDNPKANHTVQKIIDVRLQSQSKAIRIDGMPIQETYSFIARTTA